MGKLLFLPLVCLLTIQVNAFTVNQVIQQQGRQPHKKDNKEDEHNQIDVKLKKCPLEFKFPKACIHLKAPKDVNDAIQKCWSEAIDTDFKCQNIGAFMMELMSSGKKDMMSMSVYDFIFLDSFDWLVYFTDDISPNLCPLLKTETRNEIKNSFKTCFVKETGLGMDGQMVNVTQVIDQIERYQGSETNKTTVIRIAEDCSSKSGNQEDFSKCTMKSLVETCKRDPYYEKPQLPFMSEPETKSSHGAGSYGGGPPNGANGGGYGGGRPNGAAGQNHGGYPMDKPKCEPCIPLEAADEVSMAWKTCMEAPEAQDFYHKFLRCLKWEPKGDKPMEAMWPQLFTPRFKLAVFIDKDSQDAHTDCMYEKLGLGNSTDVNAQGFKDLVSDKLMGAQKVKDYLIETIDACSISNEAITSEEFTTCTVQRIQRKCDMM